MSTTGTETSEDTAGRYTMFSSGISELLLVVEDVRSSARFYEEVGRFDPDANLIEWWSRRDR
jgi:hypothetical protein